MNALRSEHIDELATLESVSVEQRHRLLAPVTLYQITPRTVRSALDILGLAWKPRVFSADETVVEVATESGLYTWVDGHDDSDPMDRAILYNGIGGDIASRVEYEESWRGHGTHGHGRVITRRNALALLGPVVRRDGVDLSFLDSLVSAEDLTEAEALKIRAWLSDPDDDCVAMAEKFAIRLSIHLGDTATPCNSQYASAWNRSRDLADLAALAVATHLVRQP